MNVLIVLRQVAFFRFFDRVVRELSAAGHTVEVLFEKRHHLDNLSPQLSDAVRALQACEAETAGFRWGWATRRKDRWRRPVGAARRLFNYASYLEPGRQSTDVILKRHERRLPRPVRPFVRSGVVRGLLGSRAGRASLRAVEQASPPDGRIREQVREREPDVVVVSPFIVHGSEEVEYAKAALALGLPTVVPVMSWDSLTTKGVFPFIPDMTLVWNKFQVEEAVHLHGVPPSQVLYTGAPVFDPWFELRPTLDRAAFCRAAGLAPDGPSCCISAPRALSPETRLAILKRSSRACAAIPNCAAWTCWCGRTRGTATFGRTTSARGSASGRARAWRQRRSRRARTIFTRCITASPCWASIPAA